MKILVKIQNLGKRRATIAPFRCGSHRWITEWSEKHNVYVINTATVDEVNQCLKDLAMLRTLELGIVVEHDDVAVVEPVAVQPPVALQTTSEPSVSSEAMASGSKKKGKKKL